jgi:predicted nucleic acid-binding protein
MSLPAAFWDSSALIPLCVSQPQSANSQLLYRSYSIVAWWATEVEIVSGLTRLERTGQITRDQFRVSKQFAGNLEERWYSVGSRSIASDACSLLERYPLRAADALQLAAALEACAHHPQGFVFITADRRQADAARLSGFSVEFV